MADRKQDNRARGRFFVLPRELRDKIYRLLFNKTYLVYGLPFYHADPSRKPRRETKADLAILRTCKIVHEEASLVLYSTAVFRFAMDYNAERSSLFPPKPLTDRMMNVDFILDQYFFDDSIRFRHCVVSPSEFESLVSATIGKFTGNGIGRKTCSVLLWGVDYENQRNHWLSCPMALAISHMTGFDQITIEVEDQSYSLALPWEFDKSGGEERSVAGCGSPADKDGNSGSQDVQNEGITKCTWKLEAITGCSRKFTHQIRDAFEDKLGPSDVVEMVNRAGIATSLSLCFHPQKQNNGKGDEKKGSPAMVRSIQFHGQGK